MHQQIRVSPIHSAPDLVGVLSAVARFQIIAAGGSMIEEDGGEFGFAVADDQIDDALAALHRADYRNAHKVDVYYEWVPNQAGALLAVVRRWAANRGSKVIRDIAIGGPGADGKLLVQIYPK